MNRIEIAPDGDDHFRVRADDNGVEYVIVELGDAERTVTLYYRLEHFIEVADSFAGYADAIVTAKAKQGGLPKSP